MLSSRMVTLLGGPVRPMIVISRQPLSWLLADDQIGCLPMARSADGRWDPLVGVGQHSKQAGPA